ncbi:hypothetical protein GRI89_16630 [Altererythrobacter salegens]|uniref:META domain-containing protein n=1 Tax=Croceibacterium salegens TaxID=1737568 RepID=A0A6I4SYW4_9SPHN|nr:hypothetical protein [Croceibacterium salegens]MXO61171.1 hypothetical protein [Croceibacterium salegens]
MAAMHRLLPLLAALALTACDGGAPPPEPAPSTAAPAPAPAPLDSLVGEYRVAGIDGQPLDAAYGIALSITDERIDFPNCRQIGWSYTFEDGKVSTERSPPGGLDAKPCDEPLPVYVVQMISAIDSAKKAERTPENGIDLKGGLRSVTLFSQ